MAARTENDSIEGVLFGELVEVGCCHHASDELRESLCALLKLPASALGAKERARLGLDDLRLQRFADVRDDVLFDAVALCLLRVARSFDAVLRRQRLVVVESGAVLQQRYAPALV
jgi:hypothetical protein